MDKRFWFVSTIIVVIMFLMAGCSTPDAASLSAQSKCIELCKEKKQTVDLSAGPCLSNNLAEGWVCDVAHSPRIASDDLPENTCSAFGVSAQSFVEVDAECNLINVYSPAPKVTPSDEKTKTISSPHGFAVAVPAGYEMSVSDNGIVEVSKDESIVIIDPVNVPVSKSGTQVLNEAIPLIKQIVGDIEITSVEQLPDYPSSYIATVKYGNKVGAILVTLKDGKGFIAGMFDDKDKYNASITDMIKIIDSFEYKNELKQPEVVGAATLKSWKDPREGAFTAQIPDTWVVSSDSGIDRSYIDANVKLVLTKGDSGISIEQLHPPLYTTPNWVLEMAGFKEGSHYNPSGGISQDMIVKTYHNAKQYLESDVPAEFGFSAPTVLTDRPDLAAKFKTSFMTELTVAEATYIKKQNDKKIVHNILVSDQYYYTGGTGLWAVYMIRYWAPEDEIGSVAKIADNLMASVKLDEEWAKKEQQETAKRTAAISASGNDISNTIKSVFEYRDRVLDQKRNEFSNAVLGVNDVYDVETGQQYTVPNDASVYWKYAGTIIGTETDTNPLNDPNVKKLYCPYC